jgi:hypothetical protein
LYVALSFLLLYFFLLSSYVQGREKENSFLKVQRWFLSYRAASHKFLTSFLLQEQKISLKYTDGHGMVKKYFGVILSGKLCLVCLIRAKRDAAGNWPSHLFVQVIYFRLGNGIRIRNYTDET